MKKKNKVLIQKYLYIHEKRFLSLFKSKKMHEQEITFTELYDAITKKVNATERWDASAKAVFINGLTSDILKFHKFINDRPAGPLDEQSLHDAQRVVHFQEFLECLLRADAEDKIGTGVFAPLVHHYSWYTWTRLYCKLDRFFGKINTEQAIYFEDYNLYRRITKRTAYGAGLSEERAHAEFLEYQSVQTPVERQPDTGFIGRGAAADRLSLENIDCWNMFEKFVLLTLSIVNINAAVFTAFHNYVEDLVQEFPEESKTKKNKNKNKTDSLKVINHIL